MFKLPVELGYLNSTLAERFVIKITNYICGNLRRETWQDFLTERK